MLFATKKELLCILNLCSTLFSAMSRHPLGGKARGRPVRRGLFPGTWPAGSPFGEVGPRSGAAQVPLPNGLGLRPGSGRVFPLFLLLSRLVLHPRGFLDTEHRAARTRWVLLPRGLPPEKGLRAPKPGGWPRWVRGSAGP